jgi:glycosyltransferase involved in cell wall biosynthesis
MCDIITHEKTGLLVNPESSTELAAAIERLLSEPLLFGLLQQAGYHYCKTNFSWPKIAADLARAYYV